MNYANLSALVVDDIPCMRSIVRRFLRQHGFGHVYEAVDGHDAERTLNTSVIDLIVCDWHMPNETGFELLCAVRANPRWVHTPFLMISGETCKENIVEVLHAGADGYIVKPFSGVFLEQRIDEIFEKRNSRGKPVAYSA